MVSSEKMRPMVERGRWMVRRRPATAAFSSDSESLLLSMRGDLDRCGTSKLARGLVLSDFVAGAERWRICEDEVCTGGVGGCFSAIADTEASTFFSNSSSDIVRDVLSKRSMKSIAPP